ncbi:hypothetical protein, partial [Haloferax profundi]|uniref:hypothetical protein n=1 Tax=Haloferax profundi TaxID=1544718 RepID=UPI000AF1E6DC
DQGATDWTLRSKTGERPPKPTTGSKLGSASNTDEGLVQDTRVTESQGLTDDTVPDDAPSITARGNEHSVVWSRQDSEKSVLNGRDIYVSTT